MTQPTDPYFQPPEITVATVNGAATHERTKSETASAATHKFVVFRKLAFRAVARQMKALPAIAVMSIRRRETDSNATRFELLGGSSIVSEYNKMLKTSEYCFSLSFGCSRLALNLDREGFEPLCFVRQSSFPQPVSSVEKRCSF